MNFANLSAANLFAGLIFSSIGFIGFIYGRRLHLWKKMFFGLALMAYPYFIESTTLICGLGAIGTLALVFVGE